MSASGTQGGHKWIGLQYSSYPAIALLLFMTAHSNGQAIIFLPCGFFLFSSPNLRGRRLDVYHTSTHGVALVRI